MKKIGAIVVLCICMLMVPISGKCIVKEIPADVGCVMDQNADLKGSYCDLHLFNFKASLEKVPYNRQAVFRSNSYKKNYKSAIYWIYNGDGTLRYSKAKRGHDRSFGTPQGDTIPVSASQARADGILNTGTTSGASTLEYLSIRLYLCK